MVPIYERQRAFPRFPPGHLLLPGGLLALAYDFWHAPPLDHDGLPPNFGSVR